MLTPFHRISQWAQGSAVRRTCPWRQLGAAMMLRFVLLLPVAMLMAAKAPTPAPEILVRTDAHGAAVYQKACAMCHGVSGEGKQPYGPALIGSTWLRTCREDHLAAIILDGVYGPIPGCKASYPVMPALRTWLNNEDVSAVTNEILRSLAGRAGRMNAEIVDSLRDRRPVRTHPWTLAELGKVPVPSGSLGVQTKMENKP